MSNTTSDRPNFVTHLECSKTGEHYRANEIHGLSKVGAPLLVRYDLPALRAALEGKKMTVQDLAQQYPDFAAKLQKWNLPANTELEIRLRIGVLQRGDGVTPMDGKDGWSITNRLPLLIGDRWSSSAPDCRPILVKRPLGESPRGLFSCLVGDDVS